VRGIDKAVLPPANRR